MSLRSVVPALLFVILLLAASNAYAGSYSSPVFSGGTYTLDGDTNAYPFPQANPYQGGHTSATYAGGNLTAKATWSPANAADTAPPVIVTQVVVAGWGAMNTSKPAASCQDGFSDPEVDAHPFAGTYSGSCGRTNYSVVQPTGNTAAVTCSGVKATLNYSSTTPPVQDGNGRVSTSWQVTFSPVTINLSGATKDSSGSYNILVGQGCTASLVGIPTACTVSGWHWSVSGTTFQDWEPTTPKIGTTPANSQASYYDPGPGTVTNSTYHWFWNDPKQVTETVSCTATVTPPAGQGSAFSITATQKVTVSLPSISQKTNTLGFGYVGLYGDATSPALYGGASPAMKNNGQEFGSTWTTAMTLPTTPTFSGTGTWGYAQLIKPGEYIVGDDGTTIPSTDTATGMTGLDGAFPYMSASHPTDGVSDKDGDVPAIPGLSDPIAVVKLTDAFQTYLMFQPPVAPSAPANDVRWVPLAESV